MIGLLAGSFIFGVLSDKIGRRHTLLLATLTCALGNLAGAFVSNKWGYAALRLALLIHYTPNLIAHLLLNKTNLAKIPQFHLQSAWRSWR